MQWVKKCWNQRIVAGIVIVVLAVSAGLWMQTVIIHRIDAKDNETRCAVVALAAQLTINSARNSKATIESKTASPDQKSAARKNLAAIANLNRITRDVLGHPEGKKCAPQPEGT